MGTMPNAHCVIDTSALLKRYFQETGSDKIDQLFDHKDCARHILNVTIPEVIAAFTRWQLKGKHTPEKRKELIKKFKGDREKRQLIVHTVNPRNVSRISTIFDVSISVPAPKYKNRKGKWRKKDRISSIDVLVLSVCDELRLDYKKAYLFTADEHMLKVAEKLGIEAYNPEQIDKLPF